MKTSSTSSIKHGDSLEVLKTIEYESVDLLCTDPPYGYSFMGKAWDKTLPDIGIFKECLRVLKPGAFAFVMSAPRSDVCARMMLMLEDAGFEIGFTPIYWTYASGFPKAMNIGKMVDKRAGVEREVIGKNPNGFGRNTGASLTHSLDAHPDLTAPATPQAKALDGSYGGFQPKPAVEVVIVAMKPLSEKTYVDQALKNGKGITWLDDCRVPIQDGASMSRPVNTKHGDVYGQYDHAGNPNNPSDQLGRFPANLLVEDDVLGDHSRFFALPFLIVPKASKSEKNAGLGHLPTKQTKGGGGVNNPSAGAAYGSIKAPAKNYHPTVKPLKLMSYLITLGSRPGDTVLDPFLGSGTTAIAAKQLGREYIGIEREEEYVEIAEARINAIAPTLL